MKDSLPKSMKHYKLVLPGHMNHQGSLFGGNLLSWIDEVAYMTANLQFPNHSFVTIALDNVEFKNRIDCGEILCFTVSLDKKGTTSLNYYVAVSGTRNNMEVVLFETSITFVSVDEQGNKCPIKAE